MAGGGNDGGGKWVQTTLDEFFEGETTAAAATEKYEEVSWYVGDVSPSEWPEEMCLCAIDCDERCRNRKRRVECTSSTCNVKAKCRNRVWAFHESRPAVLDIRETNRVGYGVYAVEPVAKGSIVCEYLGEIIDEAEKCRRAGYPGCKYLMAYSADRFIDARRYGNVSRFCNHSCEPNCRAEEWTVQGIYRIGIVARRNIRRGEEITFSYGSSYRIDECKCSKCWTVQRRENK